MELLVAAGIIIIVLVRYTKIAQVATIQLLVLVVGVKVHQLV